MTVTAKSKHALAPLFRRTSIRNPLTIERQMVCFSFPILCSELLPFSLYLTSDRITPLNPAERQSSRFYAPLYAESPEQFFDNGQQILSLRAFGASPRPPSILQTIEEPLWSLQTANPAHQGSNPPFAYVLTCPWFIATVHRHPAH